MYDILFRQKSIGKILDVTVDGDFWFSAYIELSEHGKTLVRVFTVLMDENSSEEDFKSFEPELFCNEYWSVVDLKGKHHKIEIPAVDLEKNIIMWRKVYL